MRSATALYRFSKSRFRNNRAVRCQVIAGVILFGVHVSGINGWSQSWEWAKKAARSQNDLFGTENTGTSVAVDPSGSALFTGIFRGTVQFATTTLSTGDPLFAPNGGFVAKYSNTGQFQWATKIDASAGTGIAVDALGNACVVGLSNNQLFIAKYSASGALLWKKASTGSSSAVGTGITLGGAGNIFVTGFFSGSIDLGGVRIVSSGSRDVFIAKLSSGGNTLWMTNAGGTSDDEARSIAADRADHCYVTGIFQSAASFGNQTLTSQADQNGIPTKDIFLAKYNADGVLLWVKRMFGRDTSGAPSDDFGNGVAVDTDGNTYVAGSFGYTPASDNGNIFLRKYGSAGNVIWTKTAGGGGDDYANSVTIDGEGDVYITGVFSFSANFGTKTLTSTGASDIFVVKYDTTGAVLWAVKADGSGRSEFAYSLAADHSNGIVLTGNFIGTVSFGRTSQTGNNGSEIFLAKISQPFNPNEISLSDALDGPRLTWTTGGNSDWRGQSLVTADGVDAAQSGRVGADEESWLETSVVGPGTVSFRWKLSSFGFLEFAVNGTIRDQLFGDEDWSLKTVTLTAGKSTLRWTYIESFIAPGGLLANAAWVDAVTFEPVGGNIDTGTSITGVAQRGPLTSPVSISRFDSTSAIDQSMHTWIVIHGRDSDPINANIVALATALKDSPEQYQILTVNWKEAAEPLLFDDFQGEDWIQPVAQWVTTALLNTGFVGSRVNVIGHSWGALVADEIAERIPGGVNAIIAIDPAQDVPFTPLSPGGVYNPDKLGEIDFAAHSAFSWAFRSDRTGFDSGSQSSPATADEAFVVKNTDHSLIVTLAANLISDRGAAIGRLFELRRLLNHERGPWVVNSYDYDGAEKVGGWYESVISADRNGTRAEGAVYLEPVPIGREGCWWFRADFRAHHTGMFLRKGAKFCCYKR